MEIRELEVDFFQFCPKCKHSKKDGNEDPCNECLEKMHNTGSVKPVHYDEAANSRKSLRV